MYLYSYLLKICRFFYLRVLFVYLEHVKLITDYFYFMSMLYFEHLTLIRTRSISIAQLLDVTFLDW